MNGVLRDPARSVKSPATVATGLRVPVLAATLLVVAVPALAAKSAPAPEPDAYVKRPAWGAVIGYVIDAETRQPIDGALVRAQVNAGFPDSGPAVAHTDAAGRYQLRAALGRRNSGTKVSPLIIFGEPIRKRETNIIDVVRLNVTVSCTGYKPFLGAVPIRHAAVSRFRVYLADIVLAPEGGEYASHAPSNFRWEYLEEFTVDPEIVKRGAKVSIKARLRVRREPSINYRLYAIAPAQLLDHSDVLHVSSQDTVRRMAFLLRPSKPTADDDGRREFTATARARKRGRIGHGMVHVAVFRGTDNVTPPDVRSVLVQTPGSDEERAAAALCREAHILHAEGELDAAVGRAEAAAKAAPDYRFAHEMLGDLYLAANRPEDAAEALRKVVKLDPEDLDVAYPKLAEAFIAAGRPKTAVDLLVPLDKDTTKKKHRTESRMSRQFNIALARSYLALGDFEAADKRLKRAGLLSPDLRRQLATERASAMLSASPDSMDAHSGLARALADAGRWEEAVDEFRTAAAAEDADTWQYTDMAWALMAGLESYDEALPWARRAVADDPDNAEARLRLGDCYRHLGQYDEAADAYAAAAAMRPHDFFARHWHALMLLWQGETDAAVQELTAALDLAREKGEHRPKYFAFFVFVATTKVLVHGFRYPEAEHDYEILDALTTLSSQRSSEDDSAAFLAKFTIAAALVELGMPDAALPRLRECLKARPDYVEALYATAGAHIAREEPEAAEEALQQVVAMDPLHPEAYLDLAELRLEAGDAAAAQRYILQHRRNYPESAPRRPRSEVRTTAPETREPAEAETLR
ncbi:MAG: tetratricopeptide repeat protein [Armatimonadota bacterium]|jgi:tetratricopeptide (TPR) repeat protein